MTAPRINAVDPSLTGTGIQLASGEHVLLRTSPTHPLENRMLMIAGCVVADATLHPTDIVLIEAPISHGASNTLVQLGGLAWVIRCALTTAGVPWLSIGNSQRTKWATGKGNAKKVEVLTAAREKLGYDGHDDNIADAKWIHHLGMAAYCATPEDLPAYRREVLATIPWPEINGHRPVWTLPPKPKKAKAA